MNFFQIKKKQSLPISISKAWGFFSDPKNLCVITPDYMNFKIIHSDNRSIYPGQIIKYSVSPLPINHLKLSPKIINKNIKEHAKEK